jgi:hypothetical protein
MADTGTGRYMYAITRRLDRAELEGTDGLGGGVLEVVEHRGLSAVVSTVRLDEFGEEGLRRNLEDLAWLETVARGHDTVVQAVAPHGPTAPLRLATICLDDDGVCDRLEEWHDALTDVLDRVEGRLEWSVKSYARSAPEPEPAESEAPSATQGKGAGIAYLQRKRDQTQRRMQSEEQAAQLAEEIHATLARQAVASRRLPAQDPRLTGHEGVMTLNGAYLVAVEDGEAFAAAVTELADRHPEAHVEAGGPWPPYSFAVLEQT